MSGLLTFYNLTIHYIIKCRIIAIQTQRQLFVSIKMSQLFDYILPGKEEVILEKSVNGLQGTYMIHNFSYYHV